MEKESWYTAQIQENVDPRPIETYSLQSEGDNEMRIEENTTVKAQGRQSLAMSIRHHELVLNEIGEKKRNESLRIGNKISLDEPLRLELDDDDPDAFRARDEKTPASSNFFSQGMLHDQHHPQKKPSEPDKSFQLTRSSQRARILIGILSTSIATIFGMVFGNDKLGFNMATSGSIQKSAGSAGYFLSSGTDEELIAMAIQLPPAYNNLAEWTTPVNVNTELPYFFEIPRAGSATTKHILSHCLRLIEASDAGSKNNKDATLQLFYKNDMVSRFVNIDTSTRQGINQARILGFAESGVADVVYSSLLYDITKIFNPENKLRMFGMFRHPVDRAASYYDLQRADNPKIATMSIEEYVTSGNLHNNWVTRFLVNKFGGGLTDDDLHLAMETLRKKCLVGLYSHLAQSLLRFNSYFQWNLVSPASHECVDNSPNLDSVLEKLVVVKGSDAWNLIMQQNKFDMKVFEYSQQLWESQKSLFD